MVPLWTPSAPLAGSGAVVRSEHRRTWVVLLRVRVKCKPANSSRTHSSCFPLDRLKVSRDVAEPNPVALPSLAPIPTT